MRILKFGGTSVASPESIHKVYNILKAYQDQNVHFAVIFSAFSGVTDALLRICTLAQNGDSTYKQELARMRERHENVMSQFFGKKSTSDTLSGLNDNLSDLEDLVNGIFLVRELTPRMKDHVVSFGERNSAYIINQFLVSKGLDSEYLDTRSLIITDDHFGKANVNYELTNRRIKEHFANCSKIQIATGFIASTEEGVTSTLGRGGSDYTAAIIGSALQAEFIEIWTDVSGVLTANPKKVITARPIQRMTYGEAMEMSHFGAKVIYPPTIVPALKAKVPIVIKNTFDPQHSGTVIDEKGYGDGGFVKGISSIDGIALVTIAGLGMVGVPGIAGRLFSTLATNKINIILITQASSEQSITFSINEGDASKAKDIVEREFRRELISGEMDEVEIQNEVSIIAVVGDNMKKKSGLANKIFGSLGKANVNIIAIAQGSSERNVSIVVSKDDEDKALSALHHVFFEDEPIKIFVAGIGNVGQAMLDQIAALPQNLRKKIAVHGVSNSKKMHFSHFRLPYIGWKEDLETYGKDLHPDEFIDFLKSQKRAVFVDNTASKQYVEYYASLLSSGISICTPNKVAMSSFYKDYENLKEIADSNGVYLGFETNVGAGLPIISTLKSLINSGDEIIRLEGVLSGTLSYLWNTFDGTIPFSKIILDAQEKGFTEPDPREDLGGMDVKRKLVILAREAGEELEMHDISVEPILPPSTFKASSVSEFYDNVKKIDEDLRVKVESVLAAGKKIKYIASWEKGLARMGFKEVLPDDPFYSLKGSDNMLVITSKRYYNNPLIVWGPGAGAEVTAAGVLVDLWGAYRNLSNN